MWLKQITNFLSTDNLPNKTQRNGFVKPKQLEKNVFVYHRYINKGDQVAFERKRSLKA